MDLCLRRQLVQITLDWENKYGIAPAITPTVSEYDAARLIGMSDAEYSGYMKDAKRTAVSRGHDFVFKGKLYQIKAVRPSGKPGSKITNAGKARNYKWDYLIWIRYDKSYKIQEAFEWSVEKYRAQFELVKRISDIDIRRGKELDISKIEICESR